MTTPQQNSMFPEKTPEKTPETPLPDRIGRARATYRPAREILTRATGFMDGYDFTLNPYSGCTFGCSYCYAAFFSREQKQQDNWGLWVNAKENAARLLDELKPGHLDGRRIYMSSVTDPYQPLERRTRLTREILETLPTTTGPSWWSRPAARWRPGTLTSSGRSRAGAAGCRST